MLARNPLEFTHKLIRIHAFRQYGNTLPITIAAVIKGNMAYLPIDNIKMYHCGTCTTSLKFKHKYNILQLGLFDNSARNFVSAGYKISAGAVSTAAE